MKQFIFSYTWFALNTIFKYSGLDLLRRDGDTGLKTSSACRFWTRLICTYVVILSGWIATICYIVNFETTPEKFMNASEKVYNSVTTSLALIYQAFWCLGICSIGTSKLRFLSKGLTDIQDYFNQYALMDLTNTYTKGFLWKTFPFLVIMLIGYSLVQISIGTLVFSDLNVSSFWTVLWIILNTLLMMIALNPVWYFVFMYIEVSLPKMCLEMNKEISMTTSIHIWFE